MIMVKRLFLLVFVAVSALFAACSDDDSFTTSRSVLLTFSKDTVSMDTVFSTVPTSTYTFWVYNHGDEGVRLSQVRLQRGNQTGFRVNVDGTYLDNAAGSLVNDLELRGGDSLRVFVELTSALADSDEPQLVEDNLLFRLESGLEQKVCLRAYTWDAQLLGALHVTRDTTISSTMPIVVRDSILVDSGATLTVTAPTKLYFREGAGVEVYGRLVVRGSTTLGDVVFRGDRTDRMFPYLPYDRVSGQWRGIRMHASSTGNDIDRADIHSAEYGIKCDSAAYDSTTYRLILDHSTIHNCKGAGLEAVNANLYISNTLISNTLGDCLAVYGGHAQLVYATLAQFYPFSADRGAALRFANASPDGTPIPLHALVCANTLVTGYADDVIMGEAAEDSTVAFGYHFAHCILRTPADTAQNASAFEDVRFEQPKDSIGGKQHFKLVDEENLAYDFRLDSLSTARGKATPLQGWTDDRLGRQRGDAPDIGCYQFE